jgi:hypothetical protein
MLPPKAMGMVERAFDGQVPATRGGGASGLDGSAAAHRSDEGENGAHRPVLPRPRPPARVEERSDQWPQVIPGLNGANIPAGFAS